MSSQLTKFGRPLLTLLALTFLVLVPAACSMGNQPAPTPPPADKVRIVLLPYIGYSTFYVGQAEGIFADEGIELEIVDLRRSSEALVGLAEGEIDVLPGFLYPGQFNSIARGAQIRIVAGTTYLDPNTCTTRAVVARAGFLPQERQINADDLRGARISVNPSSLAGFITDRILQQYGLRLEDVEVVDIPTSAELDAFAQGALDLSQTGEPWLTRLLDSGDAELWIRHNERFPDMQFSSLFYGPSLLEDDPELGARFLRAHLRAVEAYSAGKTADNIETMATAFELEPEFIERICWPPVSADGYPNFDSMMEFQRWAYDRGHLDRVLTPDEFWDPTALESATGQGGDQNP